MPYSSFTFERIKREFNIVLNEKNGLFLKTNLIELNQEFINSLLEDNVSLALAINTEKARSELIIVPILLEVRKLLKKQISLFSGIDFNVDEQKDLKGVCDFVIGLSQEQLFLDAPIITLVEAKRENLIEGIPQCIAEMIAAQIFNQRQGKEIQSIYGVVTTGSLWKFLKLTNQTVDLDLDEYHIKETSKIVSIIYSMCYT